jgi:hypothetical protein
VFRSWDVFANAESNAARSTAKTIMGDNIIRVRGYCLRQKIIATTANDEFEIRNLNVPAPLKEACPSRPYKYTRFSIVR